MSAKRHGLYAKQLSNRLDRIKPHSRRNILAFLPLVLILLTNIYFLTRWYNPTHKNVLSYATGNLNNDNLLASSNQRRAASGVANLSANSALNQAAQAKANDMVTRNYWSHNTPDGQSPWTFILNAGYSYAKAAENLAYGYTTSADVVTGWMNSQPHRVNLLDSGYLDVGFGYANSPNFNNDGPQTVVVAMYARSNNVPAPTPAPSQSATTKPAPTPTKASSSTVTTPTPTTPQNAGLSVTVTVLDIDSKPVEGARVSLHSEVKQATTDKMGVVIFSDVEAGQHTALIEYAEASKEVSVSVSKETPNAAVTVQKPTAKPNLPINSDAEIPQTDPREVNRLEVVLGRNLPWLSGLLLIANLIGGSYILTKHSRAFHRMLTKGERYLANHLLADITIISFLIMLYIVSRNAGFIL